MLAIQCSPTYMYITKLQVSLFIRLDVHCICLALPCLYYRRFEPGQLGCLGSSVGRALDKQPCGHGLEPCPRQFSVCFFHCLPSDFAFPCLICIYMCKSDHASIVRLLQSYNHKN